MEGGAGRGCSATRVGTNSWARAAGPRRHSRASGAVCARHGAVWASRAAGRGGPWQCALFREHNACPPVQCAARARARARAHTPLTGQASGTQSVWVRTACSREPRQQKQQRPAAAHRNGLQAPALASPVHTRARRRRAGADSAARRPRRRLLPRHSGSPAAGGAHSAACLGGQQSYDKTRRTRAPV